MSKFEVGDKVNVFGECEGRIFGIADKKSVTGHNYAITFIHPQNNKVFSTLCKKNQLEPIKSKYELEPGDKFIYYDQEISVINKHKDPNGMICYFGVNENGYCDLYFAKHIKEVLT